jgi:hypothetical protein
LLSDFDSLASRLATGAFLVESLDVCALVALLL